MSKCIRFILLLQTVQEPIVYMCFRGYGELGVVAIVNRFDIVFWLSLQRWLCASYILLQVMLHEYNTCAHSGTC